MFLFIYLFHSIQLTHTISTTDFQSNGVQHVLHSWCDQLNYAIVISFHIYPRTFRIMSQWLPVTCFFRALSWFAVGCYYYCIKKYDQSRRYFRYQPLELVFTRTMMFYLLYKCFPTRVGLHFSVLIYVFGFEEWEGGEAICILVKVNCTPAYLNL